MLDNGQRGEHRAMGWVGQAASREKKGEEGRRREKRKEEKEKGKKEKKRKEKEERKEKRERAAVGGIRGDGRPRAAVGRSATRGTRKRKRRDGDWFRGRTTKRREGFRGIWSSDRI